MITARYNWEVNTLLRGFSLHRRTLWLAKIAPIVGTAFVAIGAYQAFTAERSWLEGLPLLFFGTLLLLVARPLAFWQFRRAVRRSPSYGAEMTWTFDPQQIVLSGEGFNSTFTWSKVYSATISGEGLLLYPQKNLFHWIPASAFASPEDFDAVRSFITQNGVRTRNV